MPSPALGPEAVYSIHEQRGQWKGLLRQLRKQTSPQNYELFWRRLVERQSNHEVAAALSLSPKAVQRRYDRMLRKWHALIGRMGVAEDHAVLALAADFFTDEGCVCPRTTDD